MPPTWTPVEQQVHDLILTRGSATAAAVAPGGARPEISGEFLRFILLSPAPGTFRAELVGIRVTGPLDLRNAEMDRSLDLRFCELGAIEMTAATTRGVRLHRCRLDALVADESTVRGSLVLTRCTVGGRVSVLQSRVEGDFSLDASTVTGDGNIAVLADRLVVGHAVHLRRLTIGNGAVRLCGARIGGELSVRGGRLKSAAESLNLDAATVGGALLLTDHDQPVRGFEATGEIRLTGARVRGPLEIDGTVTAGAAVRANGLVLDGTFDVRPGARLEGGLALRGAQIGGDLTLRAAALTRPGGTFLDLSGATVKGTLTYTPTAVEGRAELTGTTVGRLVDRLDRWPADRGLDGFSYGSIGSSERPEPTVAQRIGWLPTDYQPRPYEALMTAYRSAGRDQDRRQVGLARARARNRSFPWWRRPWGRLLDVTVAYGYRPWQALGWLAGLWLTGALVTHLLHADGTLAPRGGTGPQPSFSAWLYTLDLLLPVVNLRQRDFWVAVDGTAQIVTAALVVCGWIIATAAVAALAGLLKKD